MNLRTITRTSLAGAALCTLAASWLTFAAPSASALPREGITITDGQVVERTYPGIAGSNPAGEAHTPDICLGSAYCDVIPLDVVVPADKDPEDEYFIQVQMFWETDRAPGDPVLSPDGYTLNDMDMYIYTDPATSEEAEARGHPFDGESDPWVSSGASATAPERALLFKPKGAYQIVVVNYVGVNTGYDLEVTWFNETIPTPFEKLAEEFSPSTTVAPPASTTTSTTTTIAASTSATTIAPPPTLAPVEISGDGDFDSADFDTSDFEDQLAAPAPLDLEPVAERVATPPSGLALFLWLLALPLTIVGVGGTVLARRRAVL